MPNPLTVPLIAGGNDPFGALNQQRFQWAGFNRGIEENNLARQEAASKQQNDWLLNVADMQRKDAAHAESISSHDEDMAIARMDHAKETADAAVRYAQQFSEGKRQFDLTEKFKEKALKEQGIQADTKLKFKNALDEAAIDHRGQGYAQSYAEMERAKNLADSDAQRLQDEMDAGQARITALTAKGKKLSTDENAELSKTQTRINDLKRLTKRASSTATQVGNKYNRLLDTVTAHDYTVDDQSGAVVHTPTGRKFNFRAPAPPIQIGGDTGEAPVPQDLFRAPTPGELALGGQSPSMAAPSIPWAGFAGAQDGLTATNAPVVTKQWVRQPNGQLQLAP